MRGSTTRLACWDTISSKCVGGLDVSSECLSKINFVSPGICVIGAAHLKPSSKTIELSIIRIDYRNTFAVEVTRMFSRIWKLSFDYNPQVDTLQSVVVNECTVGALMKRKGHEHQLLGYCRVGDADVTCELLEHPADQYGCSKSMLVDDDLYLVQNCQRTDIQLSHILLPRATSPITEDLDLNIHTWTGDPPVKSNYEFVTCDSSEGCTCHIGLPAYGVLSVAPRTIRRVSGVNRYRTVNYVCFWTAEHDGSTVTVGSPCYYKHPRAFSLKAVGSSGTCAVIRESTQRAVGLLQFVPQPKPRVHFRPLDVPEAEFPIHVALDDRLGVLYLADHYEASLGRTRIIIVSYA